MRRIHISHIFVLACISSFAYAIDFKIPQKDEIYTIAIRNPSVNLFTPTELLNTLHKYRIGTYEETGLKIGEDRVWQGGVIVLKTKKVIFWSTDRKRFISIESDAGENVFLIRDDLGK